MRFGRYVPAVREGHASTDITLGPTVDDDVHNLRHLSVNCSPAEKLLGRRSLWSSHGSDKESICARDQKHLSHIDVLILQEHVAQPHG
jgi:hypothetical protein